jgi:hypothetical protein
VQSQQQRLVIAIKKKSDLSCQTNTMIYVSLK